LGLLAGCVLARILCLMAVCMGLQHCWSDLAFQLAVRADMHCQ